MAILKNINFDKLKKGLSKTKDKLFAGITEAISTKAVVNEDRLDEIEETLITSDIGVDTSLKIIENTRAELYYQNDRSLNNIMSVLKNEIKDVLLTSTKNTINPDSIANMPAIKKHPVPQAASTLANPSTLRATIKRATTITSRRSTLPKVPSRSWCCRPIVWSASSSEIPAT